MVGLRKDQIADKYGVFSAEARKRNPARMGSEGSSSLGSMISADPITPTQGKAEMRPGAPVRARIFPGLRTTRRIRPARAMRSSGAIGFLGLVLILIHNFKPFPP